MTSIELGQGCHTLEMLPYAIRTQNANLRPVTVSEKESHSYFGYTPCTNGSKSSRVPSTFGAPFPESPPMRLSALRTEEESAPKVHVHGKSGCIVLGDLYRSLYIPAYICLSICIYFYIDMHITFLTTCMDVYIYMCTPI